MKAADFSELLGIEHLDHSLDELVESIEKVKAEDLQRIAVEFFNQDLVALSVLGNLGDFKVTREDLVC